MGRSIMTFTLLGLLAVATGCGSGAAKSPPGAAESAGGAPQAPSREGAAHAAAGVVPGSHEDWCAEHQVPETQCTRCDASLIPAFQASNDWCAEHGLPMSQCTIHDPALRIVRPARTEAR